MRLIYRHFRHCTSQLSRKELTDDDGRQQAVSENVPIPDGHNFEEYSLRTVKETTWYLSIIAFITLKKRESQSHLIYSVFSKTR